MEKAMATAGSPFDLLMGVALAFGSLKGCFCVKVARVSQPPRPKHIFQQVEKPACGGRGLGFASADTTFYDLHSCHALHALAPSALCFMVAGKYSIGGKSHGFI